jgi:hypothetical protein
MVWHQYRLYLSNLGHPGAKIGYRSHLSHHSSVIRISFISSIFKYEYSSGKSASYSFDATTPLIN